MAGPDGPVVREGEKRGREPVQQGHLARLVGVSRALLGWGRRAGGVSATPGNCRWAGVSEGPGGQPAPGRGSVQYLTLS